MLDLQPAAEDGLKLRDQRQKVDRHGEREVLEVVLTAEAHVVDARPGRCGGRWGGDAPHGTGVESTIQWLSNQKSLSITNTGIFSLGQR